ncbi:MAG: hypothetical protein EA409_08690 [Saprospirales bacterium]|nr:MAG: hypothetical protein EA409_08690 [Saprospirales bacterium]
MKELMRARLKKFSDFSETLLPHELEYLLSVEQFEDDERRAILERIYHNCVPGNTPITFDTEIDKRKYSHLKNWIEDRLNKIDADVQLRRLIDWEEKIATDSILPDEEENLLRFLKRYEHPFYFFRKLYDLCLKYRHFLLIRMRMTDYEYVRSFVEDYREDYDRSVATDEKIHSATGDIVNQYLRKGGDSFQWEPWLEKVFYDETLDMETRHLAFIRLSFIGLNYRRFDSLLKKFEYLDEKFRKGENYSRRILLNYYANRLILHGMMKDYRRAESFGFLSVRAKNHDFLYYTNNLASVLLRRGKAEEALKVLQKARKDMQTSPGFFNKLAYISFYMKALCGTGQARKAEVYANTYLKAYPTEILQQNSLLFFTAYLESQMLQMAYRRVLRSVRKYRLIPLDERYRSKPSYQPWIWWYYLIAGYQEGLQREDQLVETICKDLKSIQSEEGSSEVDKYMDKLKPHIEELYYRIKNHLGKK